MTTADAGSRHDVNFDGYAGGWSLISVVTPLHETSMQAARARPRPKHGEWVPELVYFARTNCGINC